MNWLRVFKFLRWKVAYRKPSCIKPQPKISLLIPFSSRSLLRARTFRWLLRYWECELPEAEIIIGHSRARVFCKGRALNNAARRATGRVLVILDADAYLPGRVIEKCADRILEELEHHLWFVPYRHLYRLNKKTTNRILKSKPGNPLRIPSPPKKNQVDRKGKDKSGYGHRFGALVTILPREALQTLGGFDERFRGWGSEDIAFLRALDTLWGRHKTTNNDVLHLWHPFIGNNYLTRKWKGQPKGGANSNLANRYNQATGNPSEMRALVDQGCGRIRTDSLF